MAPKVNEKVQYQALDYDKLYTNALKANLNNEVNDYSNLEKFIQEQVNSSKINKVKINNPPQQYWITKDIIDSIHLRNKLWHQAKTLPQDISAQKSFEEQREKVKNMIKTQKKIYYHNLFQKNYNHPKKLWELINSLALNKNKESSAPPKLISDSELVTDGNKICDLFNAFFSSVGANLASQISGNYHSNTDSHLIVDSNHYFAKENMLTELSPCNSNEISNIINDLDNNTSTGLDGISTKAIKCLKSIIIEKLTDCINAHLSLGVFPETLKAARVTPIYKSGCRTDPGNYRPVSVLPVISKIFEHILYNRLNTHLLKNNILNDRQFGFRANSNTLAAAVDLITNINTNIDKKNIALGIFIDLKKAFDTVSHQKLLQKLNNIGVTGTALSMFESNLQNRYQVVKINNHTSQPQNVSYGIAQGSKIGPLIFLIYINSITNIGLKGQLTLYADDTSMFYFGKCIHTMISDAQSDLDLLNEWFKYNLLTINPSKTSYMIFAAKNKLLPQQLTPLMINNEIIQRSRQEKYLGLWIDDNLTWKTHINYISTKLVSLLGALRRISHCIPKKISTIIYNSLVKSHLEYLVEIWGSAATSNLNALQRTQNKIIKVLYHYPYLTPTKELYKKTKLLDIKQLYEYGTCIRLHPRQENYYKLHSD